MSVIVLCGGGINYRNLPIAITASNSMIPINGKPVIGWIIDDLIEKELKDIVLVLQAKDKKLYDFIQWAYRYRCSLNFAFVQEDGTILDSLLAGLDVIEPGESVHVVLGDTLIKDDYNFAADAIYSGQYDNPLTWCLVEVDENRNAKVFYDKSEVKKEDLEAVAGYYFLSNSGAFREAVLQAHNNSDKEISKALEIYSTKYPIKVVPTREWYDFGHLDHLITAKRKLLQTRYFNSLVVDDKRGVIIKTSLNGEKLNDELNWYRQLPNDLSILAPRLIEEIHTGDQVRISQELYGYPNLAELYVFSELDLDVWMRAIDKLFDVHRLFKAYTKQGSRSDLKEMYINKTESRLNDFQKMSSFQIPAFLVINETEYESPVTLLNRLQPLLNELCAQNTFTVMHGDYCFSNILYDLQTEVVRLIDPRGSFGSKGIYGDPRYDIAKLRHSIKGMYDFIISDLFEYSQERENVFHFNVYSNPISEQLGRYFDKMVEKEGYNLEEIKLIEGLLFLSMLPLHAEKSKRQHAMFLRGTILLNEVFHENSN